jgi:Tfp pilus assembly protein PilO
MRLRADRLWLIGGALGAVALFAVSWLLVIGPQRTQAADLRAQGDAAQLDLTSLRHKLQVLEEQNANLDQYKGQLGRNQKALPTTPALQDFLRELQSAGDTVRVSVTGLVVGAPTETSAEGARIISLPITLTVSGQAARLGQFLDQLQRVQPRAVLITNANAVPAKDSTTLAGTVDLNISLQAFISAAAS